MDFGNASKELVNESASPCHEKIFEIENNGTILYGNKTELIQRVRQGAEVRILLWEFNEKNHLFATNQIRVNDHEVCAQSVFSTTAGNQFARQILMICSSGSVQEQRWLIGLDKIDSDITSSVKSTWFVQGFGRGHITDLHDLASAILSGHGVMVLTDNNRFPLHALENSESNAVAQFAWGVPQVNSLANRYTSTFNGNYTWLSRILDYSGFVYSTSWKSGSGGIIANAVYDKVQMTWLTDTNWVFIFANSDVGNPMYGCLSDLRNYAENGGHRFRVVYGTRAAEVDSLIIQGDIISAVFIKDVTKTGDFSRVVSIVKTTGKVTDYIYGLANPYIIQEHTNTTAVKWYIDTASWTEIFRVQNGTVDNSFPDVNKETVQSGKEFRIIYTHSYGNILFSADSIFVKPTGNPTAVIVNRLVDVFADTGEIVLTQPVGNIFYKFTSMGRVTFKIYDNGGYFPRTRTREALKEESFRWFVKDC